MRTATRLRGISGVLILGVPVTPSQLWLSSPVVIWRIPGYLKKVATGIGVLPALSKLELAWKNHFWMLSRPVGNPCDFYVTLEQTKISACPVLGICYPWKMIRLSISSAPENCIYNSFVADREFFSEKHSETFLIQSLYAVNRIRTCVWTHTKNTRMLKSGKYQVHNENSKSQYDLVILFKKKRKILSLHLQSLWDCQCYLQGITWTFL